jgi:hypothetical protein
MAKFIAHASTNIVGSGVSAEFEVDDCDLEGLSEMDRDNLISEVMRDVLYGLVEMYYEEV